MYKTAQWKFSVLDKTVGPQFENHRQFTALRAGSYSNVDANIGYTFSHVELSATVSNVLNSRKVLSITQNDTAYMPNQLQSWTSISFNPSAV